ncbi:Activin_recp domain-containing protein [Caenorhabditis elegans]|nr:Activin_recp domain-containing protein [Caenorhabditis elegans]CCU83318.1 Activin_recp domain-containing protein [Caenorhabditis elegans]|eukprot:NP_001294229.1 Uncharacterized protein CELE_F56C4.4 [Caenorhabditis elegans]
MKYCVESYSEDFDTVTASCQTLSTSRRILNLCEGDRVSTNIGVTTRCCSENMCNDVGIEKRTKKDSSAGKQKIEH